MCTYYFSVHLVRVYLSYEGMKPLVFKTHINKHLIVRISIQLIDPYMAVDRAYEL